MSDQLDDLRADALDNDLQDGVDFAVAPVSPSHGPSASCSTGLPTASACSTPTWA